MDLWIQKNENIRELIGTFPAAIIMFWTCLNILQFLFRIMLELPSNTVFALSMEITAYKKAGIFTPYGKGIVSLLAPFPSIYA